MSSCLKTSMSSPGLEMESEVLQPLRIDFSESVEDEQRENLPVYLRVKPQDDEEMSIKILSATTIETNHACRSNKRATYTQVFSGSSSQLEVFNGTTAHLIRKFLHGANVMTFAYGVTSSGKTHTIMGSHADPGILPRALEIIFVSLKSKIAETIPVQKPTRFDGAERISIEEIDQLEHLKYTLISKVQGSCDAFDQYAFSQTTSDTSPASRTQDEDSPFPADASCSIWISIYEIHNEVITDLFSTEPRERRKALNIGQDSENRTFIKDLTQVPVASASEAYALLQFARQNLATASTKLNDNSSRSHMVFNLKMVHWGGSIAEPYVNQFVISDLAGSERQAKTGTSGLTLKQASAINNSLLVLGRCLEALRKKDKRIAAPFRDSKLTRILNPFFALGGYLSLIICINPGMHLQDETMETVRFSAIASEIVQNPIQCLETLRHLRRLTLNSAESTAPMMFDDTDVKNWQDAVDAAAERNGVAYLEVKASYFNDMARDILRAERLLAANAAEIEVLKERLQQLEISKENVKLMYQDKMKEQRDRFAEQRSDLEELHRDLLKTLVEDYEADIKTFKEKYSKYRDGYAKLSTYIKEKLWPEVCLFRERFGCLPEFPPRDGPQNEEVEPKNTVKYWQDKLHEKEVEYRSLRTELSLKTERLVILEKQLDEQKKFSVTVEVENRDYRREISELTTRVVELSAQLASFGNQKSEHEPLVEEASTLSMRLSEAEEISRSSIGDLPQIRLSSVTEELESLKIQLSEKTSRLEETSGALASAEAEITTLKETIVDLENRGRYRRSERMTRFSGKAELEEKIVELEFDLTQRATREVEFQDQIRSLQDEVKRLTESEAELKEREVVTAFKLRDARRARVADYVRAPLRVDSKRLQKASRGEKKSTFAKDNSVIPQKADLEAFENKLKTIEALGRQMQKLSKESRENRETLKSLLRDNRQLDIGAKKTEQLEPGIEFRGSKMRKRHGRILRDYPQSEKAIRRLRSASTCGVELKTPPTIERPRRRLRLDHEENSNPKTAAQQPVRHSSSATTTRRTRTSSRIR